METHTYSQEQRKKFLMDYLDKLVDNIQIKPWKEWLIELRDALNIEIFTYREQEEVKLYWVSILDLINKK